MFMNLSILLLLPLWQVAAHPVQGRAAAPIQVPAEMAAFLPPGLAKLLADFDLSKVGAGAGGAAAGASPAVSAPAAAKPTAAPAKAEPKKEEKKKEEVVLDATFGVKAQIGTTPVKTDFVYTKGPIGSFEVEYQNTSPRGVIVTENKTPAPPPAGFVAIDPSSFIVVRDGSNDAIPLQKIDYIFDATSPAVKAVDLSKGKIGKLTAGAFVINDALGELEFEKEEAELTLTVKDMNGEWGIFVPSGAAPAAGNGTAVSGKVTGSFDKVNAVDGGNKRTDIAFAAGTSGSLHIDYTAATKNALLVTKSNLAAAPPPGMRLLADGAFNIRSTATLAPTDTVNVAFQFSDSVKASGDMSKGKMAKFNLTSAQYATEGVGQLSLKAETNTMSLKVADLNGDWAVLMPEVNAAEANKPAAPAAPPAAPLAPPAAVAPAEVIDPSLNIVNGFTTVLNPIAKPTGKPAR